MPVKEGKLQPLIYALIAVVGMVLGARMQESLQSDGLVQSRALSPERAVDEAFNHINEKFYGDIDLNVLTDRALSAVVEDLDPFSSYFRKEMDDRFNQFINGTYAGLGIEFYKYGDSLYVTDVIEDSPADEGGVLIGDVLVQLDSIEVIDAGFSVDSLYKYCQKPMGEGVQLEFDRPGTNENHEVNLIFTSVRSPIVQSWPLSDDEILYTRIHRFSKGSFTSFMDNIDEYRNAGRIFKHLIIDLRGNPGGLLDETIKLLNQLIPEAKLVLASTVNNDGKITTYESNGRGFLAIDRLVVLIDGQSASASEILAGSVQDHDRALIIGSPSFGKGLIQQNYDLSNSSSINITVGEYMLPSGRKIYKKKGVRSDSLPEFQTLRFNRPVPSGKGIIPDIQTDTLCPPLSTRRIYDYFYRIAIDEGALTSVTDTYHSKEAKEDLANRIIAQINVDGPCVEEAIRYVRWKIWQKIHGRHSEFNPQDVDPVVRIAIDMLNNEKFESILKERATL